LHEVSRAQVTANRISQWPIQYREGSDRMPRSRGYAENKVNFVWHPVAALAVPYASDPTFSRTPGQVAWGIANTSNRKSNQPVTDTVPRAQRPDATLKRLCWE